MRRVSLLVGVLGVAGVFPAVAKADAGVAGGQPPAQGQARAAEALGRLPLRFERNVGQTDSRVSFLSRGPGYQLFLIPSEVVLSLQEPKGTGPTGPLRPGLSSVKGAVAPVRSVLRVKFVGSKRKPEMTGRDELPTRSNYYIGNDPKKWRTDVVQYGRVVYHGLWKGIDLAFYGTSQGQIESDFTVSPGADPSVIRLSFAGARKVGLDGEGNLIIEVGAGRVIQQGPLVYQEVGGVRTQLDGSWVHKGKNRVGFQVARYDRSQPLVIDPVLVYSSYLGGSRVDWGYGIATDADGRAYVGGTTESIDFTVTGPPSQPVSRGGFDAFVTVLDVNARGASPVYSTYLGGSGNDVASGIAVDAVGDAWVIGYTSSTDFPTAGGPFQPAMGGGGQDAFVAKLSPTSGLLYSTYLGGGGNDTANGVAVDAAGDAYVTGETQSGNFPVAGTPIQPAGGGGADAFVAKLSPTSGLLYSTYLGGSGGDTANGIAVDAAGDAYVTGQTESRNFPVAGTPLQPASGGGTHAFVAKLRPTSGLLYSTYLGGSGGDTATGIAVDAAGDAYVTGWTVSSDFPVAGTPFQPVIGGIADAFIAKLSPESGLVYSTYLGGTSSEQGSGIAVDGAGDAFVTGNTFSTDFPTAGNPFQAASAGNHDAFVTKLGPTAGLLYSTYLGGHRDDGGSAIACSGTLS